LPFEEAKKVLKAIVIEGAMALSTQANLTEADLLAMIWGASQQNEGSVIAEPDAVIDADARQAKAHRKATMQDEVDWPDSFSNDGLEFKSQSALIPRCPWLMPHNPIS
jgi:hypothetical protein